MKFYLLIPILAVFILAGCSKENSIMGPQSSQVQSQSQWINISQSPSLSVENSYTVSKSIDGSKGGSVELSKYFNVDGKKAYFNAELTIPKGAFTGTKVITYTVNTETAAVDFVPLNVSFKKNLSLDLTFKGVNISGYKVSELSFSYFDGTNIVPVTSDHLNINIKQGLLQVVDAQIAHFSRYGWSTIVENITLID